MKLSIRKGFTLIEILIVVIILGILAAIVIPQFSNASTDAKVSAVRSSVQSVQAQLELYKFQLNTNPDPAKFWTQLGSVYNYGTLGTYGPFIANPAYNPFSGNSGVVAGSDACAATGWAFDQTTNKFYGGALNTLYPK